MNKKKIAFGIGIVLTVLAVFTASAAALPWEGSLDPQDSTGTPGGDTPVEQWVTYDGSVDPMGPLLYQVDIHFDPSCVNITGADFSESPFSTHMFTPYAPGVVRISEDNWATMLPIPAGTYKMYTLTFHAESSGSCACNIWFDENYVSDSNGDPIANSYTSGTYTCTGPAETYSKPLVAGWNLISLPLTATDMTVSDVTASLTYDELYKYNASTNSFVSVGALDTMANGVGYFINITVPSDTWTYSGTAYGAMNKAHSDGLNMIGWLNCTKDISTTGLDDPAKTYYISRWNATTQEYETYNPVAPGDFNDFTQMDRGEGYFVSMKTGGTLSENC